MGHGLTELPSFSPLLLSTGPEQGDGRTEFRGAQTDATHPSCWQPELSCGSCKCQPGSEAPKQQRKGRKGGREEGEKPRNSRQSLTPSVPPLIPRHSGRASRSAALRTRDQRHPGLAAGGNRRGKRQLSLPVPPSARELSAPPGQAQGPSGVPLTAPQRDSVRGLVHGQSWDLESL